MTEVTNHQYPVGSEQRPLRTAIVGSGPSGFYAAEALLQQEDVVVDVDIFDRLPTPYGLVRFGVAPDHQKIKNVIRVYERTAAHPRFRFFGNVQFGRDLQAEDLTAHYDQVVFAVGNETDRRLNIPGESFDGSYTATAFVAWYNGHPDYVNAHFNLDHRRVVVVGIGNVAMDVARVLAKSTDELAKTDISDYALESLRKSRVKEIVILGRRGAAQAAFTPKEIKEIGSLDGVDLVVDPADVALDEDSRKLLADSKQARQNVTYLTEKSGEGLGTNPKKVFLRLLRSPVEITGENGKVAGVKIEKNVLYKDDTGSLRPRGTDEYETLSCGAVFRSVGYHGVPLPGVPFHEKWGIIPNERGRVIDPKTRKFVPGQYVVGWMKRGPSGLVGDNKPDSAETVRCMMEDIDGKVAPVSENMQPQAVERLLSSRNIVYLTFADWKKLDSLETENGKKAGKVRDKFVSLSDMLNAVGK
ncbi:MAG: FAD-dependent oxidoreductase [Candidatus Poribacteria bacterium]|nr:FAD-dependent oxidoreductase [Candidatus Poribacteria bacterium]